MLSGGDRLPVVAVVAGVAVLVAAVIVVAVASRRRRRAESGVPAETMLAVRLCGRLSDRAKRDESLVRIIHTLVGSAAPAVTPHAPAAAALSVDLTDDLRLRRERQAQEARQVPSA